MLRTAKTEAMVSQCPGDGGQKHPGPSAGHPPGPTGARPCSMPSQDPQAVALALAAPHISALAPLPPWATCPHPAHLCCCACTPWGPGSLSQADQGNASDGCKDGHQKPLPAAPKAQPNTQDKCSLHLQASQTHARQESRHETDWARLCLRPKLSSEGAEVTVPRTVTLQPVAR